MSRGAQTTLMQGDVAISPDTPLRLEDAVRLAFPAGGMGVSGLRREAARGNLRIWKIANKQFTSLRAIDEMREKCLDIPKEPVSTSARDVAAKLCGSSSTEKTKSALAAAQAIADELKRPSPATSPASTSQTGKIVTLQR
jgi:hypothetical protein